MSLYCAGCKQRIPHFQEPVLLYQLSRDPNNAAILPDYQADYIPPNAALCETCLAAIPPDQTHNAPAPEGLIWAYQAVDSLPGLGEQHTLNTLRPSGHSYTYVPDALVRCLYPFLATIVDELARRRAERDRADAEAAHNHVDHKY